MGIKFYSINLSSRVKNDLITQDKTTPTGANETDKMVCAILL